MPLLIFINLNYLAAVLLGLNINTPVSNILFISSAVPSSLLRRQADLNPVMSSAVYQGVLLDNLVGKWCVISAPAIGSFPNRSKFLFIYGFRSVWSYCPFSVVGFVNLSVIKQFSIFISLLYNTLRFVFHHKIDAKLIIVCYSLMPAYLLPAVIAKYFHRNVSVVAIVPDLPEHFDAEPSGLILKFIYKIQTALVYWLSKFVNGFIFFTRPMAEKINKSNVPYLVSEGLPSFSNRSSKTEVEGTYTILYSGTLDKRFGIMRLVELLEFLDQNYKILICGSGECAQELQKVSSYNSSLKYLGRLERADVLDLQTRATLLINPRLPDSDYTLYSFPSKLFEYFQSGTPVIMHHLAGIPSEYYNHCIVPPDQTIKSLADTIKYWCEGTGAAERIKFGNEAKRFIYSKHPASSVKRIEEFILGK